MREIYRLFICDSGTVEQYRKLGRMIQRWIDSQSSSTGCTLEIIRGSLDDLLGGSPPRPDFIQWVADVRQSNERNGIHEADDDALTADNLAAKRKQLGIRRSVCIAGKHSPECCRESSGDCYVDAFLDLEERIFNLEDYTSGSGPVFLIKYIQKLRSTEV